MLGLRMTVRLAVVGGLIGLVAAFNGVDVALLCLGLFVCGFVIGLDVGFELNKPKEKANGDSRRLAD